MLKVLQCLSTWWGQVHVNLWSQVYNADIFTITVPNYSNTVCEVVLLNWCCLTPQDMSRSLLPFGGIDSTVSRVLLFIKTHVTFSYIGYVCAPKSVTSSVHYCLSRNQHSSTISSDPFICHYSMLLTSANSLQKCLVHVSLCSPFFSSVSPYSVTSCNGWFLTVP